MICKLWIFQTIRKLWSNHIGRRFWFLHCQKLHLQPLATLKFFTSGLWIMQIWSINYYILKMPRYANIVSIGRYLVLTYIERFISAVCCCFSYICWSVNCMGWVSKFTFSDMHGTEAKFMIEGIDIVLYGKFISDSPILSLFSLSGL